MDPSDDKARPPTQGPGRGPEHDNPFVAFKQYADEQIATMLQSVLGIPSAITAHSLHWPPPHDTTRGYVGSHAQPSYDERDTRQCGDQERNSDDKNDFGSLTANLFSKVRPQGQHTSDDPQLRCPYRPDASPTPARDSPTDHTAGTGETIFAPGWLNDYLSNSPYSPVQVECDPALRAYGTRWRRAFEDLVDATTEKPLDGPRSRHFSPTYRDECMSGPGRWIAACVRRWGDQLHHHFDVPFEMPHLSPTCVLLQERMRRLEESLAEREAAEAWGEDTELDAYERSRGAQPAKRGSGASNGELALWLLSHSMRQPEGWRSKADDAEVAENELEEGDGVNSVVATVTTTETVVEPDGTTRKRTVLRRRFADGSEKETQTDETTYGGRGGGDEETKHDARSWGPCEILKAVHAMEHEKARRNPKADKDGGKQVGEGDGNAGGKDGEGKAKKGGWFWS